MGIGATVFRYGPPHVPGTGPSMPPWQAVAGCAMCLISAGWTLWLRRSPYNGPDADDPDALTTLDLSNARDHWENG